MRNRRIKLLKILNCFYLVLVTVIGFITIVASGGGDGGGVEGGSNDPIPETGYFVDGPVKGLKYTTATQSGVTDVNGAFNYLAEEVVSFYVGDILIGQASGSEQISPFDLAGIKPPETGIEVRTTLDQLNNSNSVTPFEVAVNISVFLQSIDDDGDLSNGIQIPDQMHTLAAGVSIDFEQRMWDFTSDFQLRILMASGRGAGLWGGSRAKRKAVNALSAMYTDLNITPEIYVPSVIEQDTDADGTVDRRETYTYDNNGNNTIYEYDMNADGIADQRKTYTYNAYGYQTMYEYEYSVNGASLDYRNTFTSDYDTNGNITTYEIERITNSTVNEHRTITYNGNGNIAMEEYDNDDDGTVERRDTYTYNSIGYRTMAETDNGVDGTVDDRYIYTYDSNGNKTMVEYDYGDDGTVDVRYTYTYDNNGNLTMEEYDYNADGTVDDRYIYAYDTNGNKTMEEADFTLVRMVMDDMREYRYTYIYDSNSNLTMYEYYEYNIGGNVDESGRYTYTYDSNGNQTMKEYDSGADGTVDSRATSTYDSNGNLMMVESDSGADGTVNKRYTYTYDINGNLTMEEYDYTADGTVDERDTYTYDSNGNLTMEEYDYDADGTVDKRNTYTYQVAGRWGFIQMIQKILVAKISSS